MRAFIDTEFDGSHGPLISMGIISEDGEKLFYEVVEYAPPCEWVMDNVIPILNKAPITIGLFKEKLKSFLEQFPQLTLVCDHPADAFYFLQVLIGEDGWCMVEYPINIVIDHSLTAKKAVIRHNALSDAKAVRQDWLSKNGY